MDRIRALATICGASRDNISNTFRQSGNGIVKVGIIENIRWRPVVRGKTAVVNIDGMQLPRLILNDSGIVPRKKFCGRRDVQWTTAVLIDLHPCPSITVR